MTPKTKKILVLVGSILAFLGAVLVSYFDSDPNTKPDFGQVNSIVQQVSDVNK